MGNRPQFHDSVMDYAAAVVLVLIGAAIALRLTTDEATALDVAVLELARRTAR